MDSVPNIVEGTFASTLAFHDGLKETEKMAAC